MIVIGAGPAGLATAAGLGRRAVDAVVLERGQAPAARWRSRYDGLRLTTYRGFSQLPGADCLPQTAGRYASRDVFVAYLGDYVRHHGLDVRLGIEARRIDRNAPHGFTVATGQGPCTRTASSSPRAGTRFRSCRRGPRHRPSPGGCCTRLSSPTCRSSAASACSSSAPATAAWTSPVCSWRSGAAVTMSMRTPPNGFPRDWLGMPLGPSVRVAEHLQSALSDPLGRLIQRHVYGNLSAYGIPRAPEGYMTRFRRAGTNPAVDDGFIAAVKTHRATVVGAVQELKTGGARLMSGQSIEVDAIICATGYRRGAGTTRRASRRAGWWRRTVPHARSPM